jgi:alpha-L-fucosidase
MLPNYFYNNNYTIVQTADHIMIMTEMVHDVRTIRLGEPKPLPENIRPWMGDSWGWWEGDTLVVETTNLPLRQVNGHRYVYPGGSEDMKVTERFTRVDEQTINYEFRVDDPTIYTSPWSGEVPFKALDELVYEYACHEANYSLFNVLSGARAEEREAAKKKEEGR